MSELDLIVFFKQFPNEIVSRKYFEDLRWNNKRYCPYCNSEHTSEIKDEKPMPYRCRDCRKYFSVRTGTILSESKIPFQKWLIAMYILTSSKKGISSIYLSKVLECTQKTAWFLAHRIRAVSEQNNSKLGNSVEIDETFIGGKESNKHTHKKQHAGRGAVGKMVDIGAIERRGRIKSTVIKNTESKTLKRFTHESVKHSIGEYIRKQVHINGIESFWVTLKRGYYGIYHTISVPHLQRYVNEFVYRYNQDGSILDSINNTIIKGIGNRLTYKRPYKWVEKKNLLNLSMLSLTMLLSHRL